MKRIYARFRYAVCGKLSYYDRATVNCIISDNVSVKLQIIMRKQY